MGPCGARMRAILRMGHSVPASTHTESGDVQSEPALFFTFLYLPIPRGARRAKERKKTSSTTTSLVGACQGREMGGRHHAATTLQSLSLSLSLS